MSAEDIARINARIAELRAMEPDPVGGFYPITAACAVTARRIARSMVAMGHRPGMVVGPDPGGALVECEAVDVYVDADGRVASVVTLTEEDDDGSE